LEPAENGRAAALPDIEPLLHFHLTLTKFALFYPREKKKKIEHQRRETPMTTPRHHSHTRSFLATVAVAIPAMLIVSGLSAPSAQAGYVVTLTQVGSNVVASGSGTIDLTDLTFFLDNTGKASQVFPHQGTIITGLALPFVDLYQGLSGPFGFGGGDITFANSSSGDLVGVTGGVAFGGVFGTLFLPHGYISDTPLADSATFNNATFSSLGVTPGTYVWTWGSGADADSFTLRIGTAPPPPGVTVNTMPIGCQFFTLVAVCTQYNYSFSNLLGTGDVFIPIFDQLGVETFSGVSGLADATLITDPATIAADWPGPGNVIPPSKSIFDDPAGLLEVPENGSMTLSFSFHTLDAPVDGPLLADGNLLDPLVPGPAAVPEPSTISLLAMALVWTGLVRWKGMPC
jgi:hypothetical protein